MKRETGNFNVMFGGADNFNPLPREEGDLQELLIINTIEYFNPLPREEGDALSLIDCIYAEHFNPLPREEGDDLC